MVNACWPTKSRKVSSQKVGELLNCSEDGYIATFPLLNEGKQEKCILCLRSLKMPFLLVRVMQLAQAGLFHSKIVLCISNVTIEP